MLSQRINALLIDALKNPLSGVGFYRKTRYSGLARAVYAGPFMTPKMAKSVFGRHGLTMGGWRVERVVFRLTKPRRAVSIDANKYPSTNLQGL